MTALLRRMDDLILLIGAVFVASLAAGAFAFTRPTEGETAREIPYSQSGLFSYSADATDPGVYDGGKATTGDPVFSRLSDKVTFGFRYRLSMPTSHTAAGVMSLSAEVSEASGWKRTLAMSSAAPFAGDEATSEGTLSLTELRRLTESFATATGVARPQFTLTLRPSVAVEGTAANQALTVRFAPALVFLLDETGLRPAPGGDKREDAVSPGEKSFLLTSERAPRNVSALAFEVPVARLRTFALAGLAFSVIAGAALVLVQSRAATGNAGLARALANFGETVVVAESAARAAPGVVRVRSLADLVTVARAEGTVVVAYVSDDGVEYRVRGLAGTYGFGPEGSTPAAVEVPA